MFKIKTSEYGGQSIEIPIRFNLELYLDDSDYEEDEITLELIDRLIDNTGRVDLGEAVLNSLDLRELHKSITIPDLEKILNLDIDKKDILTKVNEFLNE